MGVAAQAEIVFVDLDDLPVVDEVVLTNPPFMAAFLHGPPCEELPPGIWGPPCIAVYCGWFADTDGSADRLSAGEPIGTHLSYVEATVLSGFEIVNPDADPTEWIWRPIINDWFDRSGAPVRGYMAWGGESTAGDPHYGWIELTVEYDPAAEEFAAVIHGYAFETEPGVAIVAGDTGSPCPGDLDGDGVVGLADLAQLLANYGTAAGMTYEDGDLDGDGDVDLSDLAALLAVYNTRCE
jgi:hypothetical protein